jgi:hypothetical protein
MVMLMSKNLDVKEIHFQTKDCDLFSIEAVEGDYALLRSANVGFFKLNLTNGKIDVCQRLLILDDLI